MFKEDDKMYLFSDVIPSLKLFFTFLCVWMLFGNNIS